MPNSATIRCKKVNLVFIIYMVEIEMNAGSKGSKMLFFFVPSSNKPTISNQLKDRASVNKRNILQKSSQIKLEKGCPNSNCFKSEQLLIVLRFCRL